MVAVDRTCVRDHATSRETSRRGGRVMTRRTFQRVTTVVLIGAVIGGAALVGARAWAQGSGGMHAGMMKRMISAAPDGALDQAAVTAEPRQAIHAAPAGDLPAF